MLQKAVKLQSPTSIVCLSICPVLHILEASHQEAALKWQADNCCSLGYEGFIDSLILLTTSGKLTV